MNAKSLAAACALALLAWPAAWASGSQADLEERAAALESLDAGLPGEAFFAAEARAWLWSAKHEDARDDATGYAARAREQASIVIERLERRAAAPHADPRRLAPETTLGLSADPAEGSDPIPAAEWQRAFMRSFGEPKARLDIQRSLDAMVGADGFACSGPDLAKSYASLSHARNALDDLGWRYADPYFRLSEAHLAKAKEAATKCSGPSQEAAAEGAPR